VTVVDGDAGGFRPGDRARVVATSPEGNPRTPGYALGREVRVVHAYGTVSNPTDHRHPYPPLYTVRLPLDVTDSSGPAVVYLDLHDDWLEAVEPDESS
jgi:hypothetical protein